jgi:hypothetical protein
MSLIIPANSLAGGGYEVDNSLRFNNGSSDYLSRTPGSAGNTKKFTISFWVKRSVLGTEQDIIHAYPGSGSRSQVIFNSANQLALDLENNTNNLITTRLFRDISAWYHIVIVYDSDNGTTGNRVILYINGVRETSFGTEQYPSSGSTSQINTTTQHEISSYDGVGQYLDCYLSEFVFLDGTAAAVTDFGEFDEDSGIWKPIDVSGLTFGTNGFYLEFKDSSALGDDTSGNTNDFTVNNLTSIDQTTDTPTNNFCTGNPLACPNVGTLSEGNLQIVGSTTLNYYGFVSSTIGMSSGKWYAEFKKGTSGTNLCDIGITPNPMSNGSTANDWLGSSTIAGSYSYDGNNGNIVTNGIGSAYGSSYTTGDIVSVALDLTNSKLYVAKNGTWQNSADPVAGTGGYSITAVSSTANGVYFFAFGDNAGSSGTGYATVQANFGSPMYSANSYTDGAGFGNFSYAVPTGYLSLCTKNLSEVNS